MKTVHEIEDAIAKLPDDDLIALRAWFAEFDALVWDRQFERDVSEGRLEELAEEALRDSRGTLHRPVKHRANPRFWDCYHCLPDEVQRLADASYALLRHDAQHPSLHLKKVGRFWSVRVGLHDRALAIEDGADLIWFWIERHAEYDRILGRA